MVPEPEEIRYHLEKAVYLARTGRPGSVWGDIPLKCSGRPIEDAAGLHRFDPVEVAGDTPGERIKIR